MKDLLEQEGEHFLHMDPPKRRAAFIDYSLKKNIRKMKEDLEDLDILIYGFPNRAFDDPGKLTRS